MTIALEHLDTSGPTARNFERLMSLVIDTGGQSVGVRFGSASVSFSASATGSQTVTHGLGRTPAAVLVTASGASANVNCAVGSVGATTFSLKAQYLDGVARTTSEPANWAVIG